MPYGALRPSEVEHLASIVERHCLTHGIRSTEGKESVAASAVIHYQRGITEDEVLLAILAAEDDPLRSEVRPASGASRYAA